MNYVATTEDFKVVADAIRIKSGISNQLTFPDEFASAIQAISDAPKDPHTLLLLHGDSMEDSSEYNVPLSNNGVTVSTAQSKFGGKSLYFDGNSWINFPQKYASYMDKDFTIDWWEYCTTSDVNHQSRYFSTDAGGPYKTLGLLLGHLGKQAYCGDSWSMINGAEMFNTVQNQWVHWATVRYGNMLLTFRNGKKFAQTSLTGPIPYDEKTAHCIGGWRYSAGQKWIGYMDEFRISDVARWTADFVPPTVPYDNLEHCKEEQEKNVTIKTNGTSIVVPDSNKTLSKVNITVQTPEPKPEQIYNKTYTQNGDYLITPDTGKVISSGSIKIQTPAPKIEEAKTIDIKANGTTTITPTPGKVMNKVTINTNTPEPKEEQEKTISAIKNGPVTITPDEGKVLSSVTIDIQVPTGPDISDATATPAELFQGKTAYLANGKATGTFTINEEISAQNAKIAAIEDALKNKTAAKGEAEEKVVEITENGTKIVQPSNGKTISKVTINTNVPQTPGVEKTVAITENKRYEFLPEPGTLISKLIANVSVNSGSQGSKNAVFGTITFPGARSVHYQNDPLTITHNLGKVPTFFAIFKAINATGQKPRRGIDSIVAAKGQNGRIVITSYLQQYPEQSISTSGQDLSSPFGSVGADINSVEVFNASNTTITIGADWTSYEYGFRGNVEYIWVAGIDE